MIQRIFLFFIFILMAGCSDSISEVKIIQSQQVCQNNQGISNIFSESFITYRRTVCNNGVQFIHNKKYEKMFNESGKPVGK